jgi:hypothetical protein
MDRQLLILSIENLLVISGWLSSCESRFISLVINLIHSRQKSNVVLLQMLLFIDIFLRSELLFSSDSAGIFIAVFLGARNV